MRVFPITDKKTGLAELHTYPIGIVDQILVLVGANGLLDLSQLISPQLPTKGNETTYDWKSFRLAGGNPSSPGRPTNSLSYAGAGGDWAAFPSYSEGKGNKDWSVKWRSGKSS